MSAGDSWRDASRRAIGSLGPFLGLFLVMGLFAFVNRDTGRYLTPENLRTIAVQTAITGVCGVGMTLVIIGGGIDLSVGSAVAAGAVTIALVFRGEFYSRILETVFLGNVPAAWGVAGLLSLAVFFFASQRIRRPANGLIAVAMGWAVGYGVFHQQGAAAAVVAGVVTGAILGLVNGLLITTTEVVPFIITLGTMEVFRGAAQLVAKGEAVGVDTRLLREKHQWLRELMAVDPTPAWLLVSPGVWIMIAAGLVAMLVLRRTRWGRYIFAVGSNEKAARLSGVPIPAVKLLMYGGAGLLTGLASVMQFSRLNYGSSTSGTGLELDVIAAVVIGGGSLRGGEGSILGTFIGAAIMGFMRNGCDLAGIPNAVQRILIGAIIVAAVTLDEIRHPRR